METIIAVTIVFLVVWGLIELLFYFKHKHPLSEKEITRLSIKRRRRYLWTAYNFEHHNMVVDKHFKSSMSVSGKLYTMNEDLHTFPSTAAALLKSKKHEWILLALATDDKVKYLWMNKGFDNESVNFFCNLSTIVKLCKNSDSCTIMCFHNHPNGEFSPSPQDIKSAKSVSGETSSIGVNWLEFVCVAGKFSQYYQSISPSFLPKSAKLDTIHSENGLSDKDNYTLHRELGLLFRF